jgi:single-strand DNA-binding protein
MFESTVQEGYIKMPNLNKVMLIGNLGMPPEMRFSPDGEAVTRMRIATHATVRGKEFTDWHTVVVFGSQAEICNKYLSKGECVFVEGRLETHTYDKDGETREKTEIIASRIEFLSKTNKDAGVDSNGT